MPKELTHWLLADRIHRQLPADSRLAGIISQHHSLYLIGAVLPDTLLHLYRGPASATALDLADRFHDTVGNSFEPLIRAESAYPGGLSPAMLACLLGVITHMQADIVFHPLVNALTGQEGIGRHYRVETDIDCCFVSAGTLPAITRLTDLFAPGNRETAIEACSRLFDPEGVLPRIAIEDALELHCRIQAMYDSTFWKLAALLLATVVRGPYRARQHLFYPLSSRHTGPFTPDGQLTWRHPHSGEQRHCSLNDLVNETVARGVTLFSEIEIAGSLTPALNARPGENLSTGLFGVRQDSFT